METWNGLRANWVSKPAVRAPESAGRALEPAEKALESARRVSELAQRALEPARRALEPTERALESAGRGSEALSQSQLEGPFKPAGSFLGGPAERSEKGGTEKKKKKERSVPGMRWYHRSSSPTGPLPPYYRTNEIAHILETNKGA